MCFLQSSAWGRVRRCCRKGERVSVAPMHAFASVKYDVHLRNEAHAYVLLAVCRVLAYRFEVLRSQIVLVGLWIC